MHATRTRLLVLATALVAFVALAAAPGALASGRAHHRAADRNHDRIPDRWERRFHLSLKVKQTHRDQDRDGLNNRAEFLARTDPRDADTDDDGREDGEERAGKVASFDGKTLVMQLFGGDTVSGTVDRTTEIECHGARELEDEADDDQGEDRARAASDDEPGDDHGDDDQGEDACPASTLAPGAIVHEAKLAITSAGKVWRKLELVASATA